MQAVKHLVQINLKESEVHELLKLQELFHSHYMTQELLNAMVGLYVRFVQNIHINQHPLRIFFMEKIKFVLSRPQTIKILEKQSTQKNKDMRQTIRDVMRGSIDEELEMKRLAQEAKKQVRQNHMINMKKERRDAEQDESLKEKERNMKIEMQMKIMQEVEENMRKMNKEFKNEGAQRKKKEEQINNIMEKQDNALKQRRALRKKKLRKKSMEFKETEVIEVQAPSPPAKQQLLEMKKLVQVTFERFTRLTMGKTQRITERDKENEGKVTVKKEVPKIEEDFLDQLEKEQGEDQRPASFVKKKKVQPALPEPQERKETEQVQASDRPSENRPEAGTTVQYQAFDQKKGRVTVRQKVYEQIDDDELF